MIKREKTKKVKVGNLVIGGSKRVAIQTMLTNKTADVKKSIDEINKLEKIGCELVRLAILNEEDATAIKKIKENTHLPIICDIHYSAKLALLSIQNGADAIRINPGNFNNERDLAKIIKLAKEKNIAIRIGINTGSFPSTNPKVLVRAMLKEIKKIEKMGFSNLVLAIKSSDIDTCIKANLLLANKTKYPLHIGLTEAGNLTSATIKSSVFFYKLLSKGIGNTIRVSLPDSPEIEIDACKSILKINKLLENSPEIISCPTCGRITADTKNILELVTNITRTIKKPIKIAVMGCIVNGVGEAKDANIGIFPINSNEFVIYVDGKVKTKTSINDACQSLLDIINSY